MLNHAFNPAIKLVKQLTYTKKFLVVFSLFVILLIPPLWGFYGYESSSVGFSKKEDVELAYIGPVKAIIAHTTSLKANSKLLAAGSLQDCAYLKLDFQQLQQDFKNLDAVQSKYGKSMATVESWQKLEMAWKPLRYYVMDTLLFRLPVLNQYLSDNTSLVLNLAKKKVISADEQHHRALLENRINDKIRIIKGNLDVSIKSTAAAGLRQQLVGHMPEFQTLTQNYMKTVSGYLLRRFDQQSGICANPAQIQQDALKVMETVSNYYDQYGDVLSRLLKTGIQKITAQVAKQVNEADRDIRLITENIEELVNAANEIAKGAGEASAGATQMAYSNENVSKSSHETEQGAVGVTLTAEELANLSQELQTMVQQFKIAV